MGLYHFNHTWVYNVAIPPDVPPDPPGEDPDDIPDVPPSNPVVGQSKTSGLWSNPATWHNNIVPVNIPFIISTTHTVTYDLATTNIQGGTIQPNGRLQFKPDASLTLRSNKNIIVNGFLKIRPTDCTKDHIIEFYGINESLFIGGGGDPLPNDIGLWVMGAGQLDIQGCQKKGWTRSVNSVNAGSTSMALEDATGWKVGDEFFIVPMDTPSENTADWDDGPNAFTDSYRPKFERRVITNKSGNTIQWSGGLIYNHPIVTNTISSSTYGTRTKTWKPEVANLNRNVKIRGTKDAGDENHNKYHRTHIFIRSTSVQSIKYLEVRYTGPRKIQGHPSRPDLVSGRYGIHFHHCKDKSIGSVVEGCVIYDSGNRCYVPHVSDGVIIRDCVAFNSMQQGIWWDHQEISHSSLWQRNLVACMTQNGRESNSRGVLLQIGDDNVAEDNVVVYGHSGDPNGGGGYAWDADSEGVWIFRRNLSHSCVTGLFVWQNTSFNHTIDDHETFECVKGVFHGAYINAYLYNDCWYYKAFIDVKATSGNSVGVQFLRAWMDAGGQPFCAWLHDSPVGGTVPTANRWTHCVFRNSSVANVRLFTTKTDDNPDKSPKAGALIRCDTSGTPILYDNGGNWMEQGFNLKDGNTFFNQVISGQNTQYVRQNQQNIINTGVPSVYPDIAGTGKGLMGSYYVGPNFNSLQFSRVDSMIMFLQWTVAKEMSPFGVHHKIQGDNYSMRWVGKLEPQYTASHIFYFIGGGGHRLWINNNLVLDSWFEKGDNDVMVSSSAVNLTVGQRYDIKVEHFNTGGSRGCMLFWKSPQMPIISNIPQSQLYVS